MRKLILKNHQSPGDVVMLTAAVRDLHLSQPNRFITDVNTSCPHLWENNPYITKLSLDDSDIELIDCRYPLIHKANTIPYHFVHAFRMFLEERLGVKIEASFFKGDIYISDIEKSWYSQVQEMGIEKPFWIINAGGKFDFSCKWIDPKTMQEVVDYFEGKIVFVQCGSPEHWHKPLKGVVDLIGKTDLRQLVRLMYHSSGVLCPVTCYMHLAAAIETRPGMPKNRPCVVVAGGREPTHWEAYPHHRYLSMVGALDCCDNGGCWKSRCQLMNDNDSKDKKENLCIYPVQVSDELRIAKCMDMIKPHHIIDAIESYYKGGALKY